MDVTQRFADRVENYIKFRPGYPKEVVSTLQHTYSLTPDKLLLDVGSGTGILTALFLERGYTVIGLEPNQEMREAGERLLAKYEGFRSNSGQAESTGLPDQSVEVILAAQAFHWFDKAASRREFVRILKPGGILALIWNERKVDSLFLEAYEAFLHEHGRDYAKVDHRKTDAQVVEAFFAPSPVQAHQFPNQQLFDYEGLEGRYLSSSYAYNYQDPECEPALERLKEIFDTHAIEGKVAMTYDTWMYVGMLT